MNKEKMFNDLLKNFTLNKKDKENVYFFARLGEAFHKMEKVFSKLYGNRADYEENFYKLIVELKNMYDKREQSLKELDIKRSENSKWFLDPKWIGTMLYVDRYNKDLKGFKEKIN